MVTVVRGIHRQTSVFSTVIPGHSVEIDRPNHLWRFLYITRREQVGGILITTIATLTIAHCTVFGNAIVSASSGFNFGGGIHNSGTMTLNQVIVNNNNTFFGGMRRTRCSLRRRRHLQLPAPCSLLLGRFKATWGFTPPVASSIQEQWPGNFFY